MKNKNRKKRIVLATCISIATIMCISAVIVFLLIVMLLRGCGEQSNQSNPETSTYETLDSPVVEQLLEDTISQEVFEGDDLLISYQFSNAVVNFTTYEVLSLTEQNTAIVEFVYIDVLKMADEYNGSDENPDEFYLYCIEKIENGTAPTIISEVEIALAFDEADGTYKIVDSIELADALTGGIASAYLEILNGRS